MASLRRRPKRHLLVACGILSGCLTFHEGLCWLSAMHAGSDSRVATLPRVGVQLVTYERPEFMLAALQQIAEQDYVGGLDVVVVDDSSKSSEDAVVKLSDAKGLTVKYLHLPDKTAIGTKRNMAIANTDADVFCIWDDDDVFTSDRISEQVRRLTGSSAHAPRGCTSIGIRYRYSLDKQLLNILPATSLPPRPFENTLCFSRSWLEESGRRFADQSRGEMEQLFTEDLKDMVEAAGTVPSEELPFIYVRHKGTVCGDGVLSENDPMYRILVTREAKPLVCPVFLSLARALRDGRFPKLPGCKEYTSVVKNIYRLVAERLDFDMSRLRREEVAHAKAYQELLGSSTQADTSLDDVLADISEVQRSFCTLGSST
eukprot:TRINITY_DN102102_c0_g1_i1.p1 TRINITY_DN102102_c0_g1~~TRINITY_DN102102_c0_g1_i1.p1  ORF type:complete len:381 (-),score=59.97 TRINITY_DN102102_c0_g1_i1:82-1197(-)